ncbi:TauD/TfdA family dioxygenase [Salinicola endophyticus]|uniref:TauD/TfdA family dioxygenase n=1 Tax=Salinicola endophyticus TaxID=1949083 RepID=A0AB74UGC0_9GAMM
MPRTVARPRRRPASARRRDDTRSASDRKIMGIEIDQAHVLAFKGMTREENQPLIRYLTERIAQSEFTFRVTWEKDMVALWDNRLVHHHAVNDYHGALRVMDRITVNDRELEA